MSYDQIIQYGQGDSGIGSIYAGSRYQRGHGGIGCFLAGLFRRVLPVLRSGAKFLGKETLRTGLNIANDMSSQNIPFKESFRSRVKETGESLKRRAEEKLDTLMAGSGYKIPYSTNDLQSIESRAGIRKRRKLNSRKKKKKTPKKKKKICSTKKTTHALTRMNSLEISRMLSRISDHTVGVFPADRIPKVWTKPTAFILNTDDHTKPGMHWRFYYHHTTRRRTAIIPRGVLAKTLIRL
ncbi:unnamed protein product [Trichogramma brassicae]|uniref:Uncharacterized protein n=1 Tax=Trichogramma brassicae TaxID=86971 RepID=A0A6H5J787_9HYME|nr:unnamed protein product [Trichogramma brassicae]